MASAETKLISDMDKLLIALTVFGSGWIIYQLSVVLTPFYISALLAYLGDPLVKRLEKHKLSRTVAVSIVFAMFLLLASVTLFVLMPLLGKQLSEFLLRFPEYLAYLQQVLEPWLAMGGFSENLLEAASIRETLGSYWSELGSVASGIFGYVSRSGMLIFQWFINLLLVPVLTFYLLRDWALILDRIKAVIPPRYQLRVCGVLQECDTVLSSFMRGQLMVMLALAIIYSIGLALIGLELALLLGVIAGVVGFVPYLGLVVGIFLAGLAAFFQFQEWLPVLMVFVVFGLAQAIEAMILTPRFVGGRIGLHPVAVIFAVLAGGQLFGFVGVLLALPCAAVVMVLARRLYRRYTTSHIYN